MPTKGDPSGKGAAQRAKFRPQSEFVRFTLTDEQKKIIKTSSFTASAMSDAIEELTQEGYKITFRWDDYGECQGCWLVAPDKDNDNAGLILAGRGSTGLKAFKQAYWLHTVEFKAIWPHPTGTSKQELDD